MSSGLEKILCRETNQEYSKHESSYVDDGAKVGANTSIWHFSHIMADTQIGQNCNIGQNVFIASGVIVGNNVKIQNNVSIYKGVILEDDVFLGPSCVLTNVINPRSEVNRRGLYDNTIIRKGVTIGANATIVCGIELGAYSFIAAGAVVTKHVKNYALMMGNPARQRGWISRHGIPLKKQDEQGFYVCAETGYRYKLSGDSLVCVDLADDEQLPEDKKTGAISYIQLRNEK